MTEHIRILLECSKCGYAFYVERLLGFAPLIPEEIKIKCPRCKASSQTHKIVEIDCKPCRETETIEPTPSPPGFWRNVITKLFG